MSQGQNFLPKFLFVSNLLKAMKIRQRVPNDVVKPAGSGGLMHHLRGMHRYTLEMIAMNHFPQAFREVVQAAILDRAMQASLEQEKKLNWCREVKKMVPLRTNGNKSFFLILFKAGIWRLFLKNSISLAQVIRFRGWKGSMNLGTFQ